MNTPTMVVGIDPSNPPSSPGAGQVGFEGDARLQAWVQSVLGRDVHIALQAPGPGVPDERGVGLYCWALAPGSPAQGQPTAPLQFNACYWVTTWSPEPAQAQADLFELTFSALETPALELDWERPAPAMWTALGLPPRPFLGLRLSVQRARRPHATAPWVRQPLVLASVPMVALQGRVVGPGGVPLAAARVELPGLGLAAQTASSGQFRFAAVPAGALQVHVLARGHTQSFSVHTTVPQPLQLDMNFT